MITSDPFFIPQELRNSIFAMAASGESMEAMCQRMADAHLEKMAAIKLLREATHSTLYEAKEKIHFSKAYRDRCASDDAFHDSVFKALEAEGLAEAEPSHQLKARAS
jgi:ribosomal protein L7/L12